MEAERELGKLIGRVRRRWAVVAALRAASRGACLLAVLSVVAVLFDTLAHPQGAALLMVATAVAASAIAVAGLVVVRAPRLPRDRQVARFIEERAVALGRPL